MTDATEKMPGVYIDLDDLLALEHRGRRVSFLPKQPVHSLLSGRYASRMRAIKVWRRGAMSVSVSRTPS